MLKKSNLEAQFPGPNAERRLKQQRKLLVHNAFRALLPRPFYLP